MGNGAVTTAIRSGKRSLIAAIPARFILTEAGGALGDLGTFVPLVVSMVQIVGLDAATVLVFAGLANIVTGLVFRIPIAVQPMKAICALAIAGMMTPTQLATAGLTVAVCMIVIAALKWTSRLERVIPRAVVHGLQAAVAAKLLAKGVTLGLFVPAAGLRPWLGTEGLAVAGAALAVVIVLRRRPAWAALGLVAFGLVIAMVKEPALLGDAGITLWRPGWVLGKSFALSGIWIGGVPQIPLTLLNSVFAVSVLAGQLFPSNQGRTTPTGMAVSVGLMNIFTCPFGGMPICHGSGGLAGQHRFGARSGLSVAMLGSAKVLVGLLFGALALAWMRAFPAPVLAVFLLMAAVALAGASRFWRSASTFVTALVMVIISFLTGQLAIGFVAGWIAFAVLRRREATQELGRSKRPHGPSHPREI